MATALSTAAPDQDAALARVAALMRRHRTSPAARRRLADRYDHIAASTDRARPVLTAQIPLQRDAVRVAETALRDISLRLRQDVPSPRAAGVDAARRLVTDASGPLYTSADIQLLQLTARDVLARLS